MQIAFRTDASLQIGSGHVMRCLTLAEALREIGAQCHFISRAHPGHLFDTIRQRGFAVNEMQAGLPSTITNAPYGMDQSLQLEHAAWLGCDWQTDADQTSSILASIQPDWLITDHYALGQPWEVALKHHYKKLMVIDDLADRSHCCDLLLDQNLGRQPKDYAHLVPTSCQVLTGPRYALLRPEFAALRSNSLLRRAKFTELRKLFIAMGGVDHANATGQVLHALQNCALPADCRITVVIGLTAPWLKTIYELAAQMPWSTEVEVNIDDMAQRMGDSDLAIGAAGSTAWERCCLGLPTLMVVLAQNQLPGALALSAANAAQLIGEVDDIASQLPLLFNELVCVDCLIEMGCAASTITDGLGTKRVLRTIVGLND